MWPAFRSSNRWFPNEIVTQIPCVPENRWVAYRGLPPGILGKPIHRGGGGAAKYFPTGRLQMHKAWQPSLPLKRKELAVFGAGPLSLGQNKTKQNPKPPFQPLLPMSFQLRTIASFKFHLSFETICGNSDHWHFYFYLSDWEALSLFQTILLKRVELTPSAVGRMVTSEGRGRGAWGIWGELGALGRTGLVQIPACLRLSCIAHEAFTHSLPKTFKSLDLYNLPISSPLNTVLCIPLSKEVETVNCWKNTGSFSFQKFLFFPPSFGIKFLALGTLALCLQEICKLISAKKWSLKACKGSLRTGHVELTPFPLFFKWLPGSKSEECYPYVEYLHFRRVFNGLSW